MKTTCSITKYEQSAIVIATPTTTIAIDFGSLTLQAPSLNNVDGVLISHVHPDHFNPILISEFRAPVYGALEVVEHLTAEGRQATLLEPGKSVKIGDVEIEPVNVDHGSISVSISNLGFLIRAAGHSIFFTGDMAVGLDFPTDDIDLLLVPVGGGKVFSAGEAAAYLSVSNFRGTCIPVHYHGSADPSSGEKFRSLVNQAAVVRVLEVGATHNLCQ